jgi:hypothetical protein
MTHTYIQAIKQPTLHYLTRSVRRRAATFKRAFRRSDPLGIPIRGHSSRIADTEVIPKWRFEKMAPQSQGPTGVQNLAFLRMF